MKSFLIAGGAGFIGANFAELILSQGHKVVVLDLLTYAGHPENLQNLTKSSSYKFYEGDIRDPKIVTKICL